MVRIINGRKPSKTTRTNSDIYVLEIGSEIEQLV